jgi:hypothetical protein
MQFTHVNLGLCVVLSVGVATLIHGDLRLKGGADVEGANEGRGGTPLTLAAESVDREAY